MRILFFSFLLLVSPLCVHAFEQVTSFTSDIALAQDGTFEVVETIVYDFGEAERHGIFRFIEKKHPQQASSFWNERYLDIEVKEVLIDGGQTSFEITNQSQNVQVKIGDADKTITGEHVYTIVYDVEGGLSLLEDGSSELYWNVTGNEWEVPIRTAVSYLRAPQGVLRGHSACYQGFFGASNSCDEVVLYEDGIAFSAHDLREGEGLTIAHEVDSSVVSVKSLERFRLIYLVVVFVPCAFLALIFFGYRYRTKYKTGKTIIAQYEPYVDFKPMYTGMLFDGRLDPQDITAGIVYLAEQGYIKITKTDKKVLFFIEVDDYSIELQKPVTEIANVFLRDVLELLFSPSASVGSTIRLSALQLDTAKQRANALQLQQLRTDLKKDMQKNGFFETKKLGGYIVGALTTFFFSFFLIDILPPLVTTLWFISLTCILVVLAILYERRTRRGYEAQDHLKGFKLFLATTDEERFKFHNAPEKSPEQFMEYLPYAIAFGVEKQWAKVFEGITIPNPGWYDGGNVGTFSAVNLTTSLGAFSTSFTASSGSSGSGGSGSSGGGGGGGGGGSW